MGNIIKALSRDKLSSLSTSLQLLDGSYDTLPPKLIITPPTTNQTSKARSGSLTALSMYKQRGTPLLAPKPATYRRKPASLPAKSMPNVSLLPAPKTKPKPVHYTKLLPPVPPPLPPKTTRLHRRFRMPETVEGSLVSKYHGSSMSDLLHHNVKLYPMINVASVNDLQQQNSFKFPTKRSVSFSVEHHLDKQLSSYDDVTVDDVSKPYKSELDLFAQEMAATFDKIKETYSTDELQKD